MTERPLDLQEELIERLETALSIPNANIIPAAMAKETDHLDPRVTVAAWLDGSTHGNRIEGQTARARIAVDSTKGYVEANTLRDLAELKKAVIDEATADSPAWSGEGVSTDDPIRPDDDLNRFLGAVETTHERTDVHPQHTE